MVEIFSKKLAGLIFFFVPIGIILLVCLAFFLNSTDTQCTSFHTTTTKSPIILETSGDFYQKGNYDYDSGNCKMAIDDYTKAISLNHNTAQIYNNRAYTYMRMQNYKDALHDLNTALMLNPHYISALMNRGDIYNYYYAIDKSKAIRDYNTVLTLVKNTEQRRMLSLCGHRLLAQNNGWNLHVIWQFITEGLNAGCN